MFWNSEFLETTPSHIDVLLQMQTVKLSDILFEDDLLQELKTSNVSLANFLNKPEIIAELVDHITQLTEKDCCDKLLYSRVHAAYISCEILTSGSSEIFAALMNHPESLNKIISCLTIHPKLFVNSVTTTSSTTEAEAEIKTETEAEAEIKNETEAEIKNETEVEIKTETEAEISTTITTNNINNDNHDSTSEAEIATKPPSETTTAPVEPTTTTATINGNNDNHDLIPEAETATTPPSETTTAPVEPTTTTATINGNNDNHNSTSEAEVETEMEIETATTSPMEATTTVTLTKVVPQKATLVSKLIGTIHTLAAANLSCHITQDIASFASLIDLLVHNIDVSGSFEILSTFIKRTSPPELRYVFCEVLSKLYFVHKLVDVMTLSDVEDKQRNACQLLCDIIVIGRQEASEQTDSGPMAQDMLAELLESTETVHVILKQMFSEDMRNSTAIVCGMKVLQTLIEQKSTNDVQILAKTIEQIQEEIEEHLIKFHDLLLNPPKQEPIKTTFGVIQKPLGYMRLEVVSLIRAVISTNSPNIIRKLVELKTMKVILDLFIEYSWNNLLHTQVEQALCLIINNYRKDEEFVYQIDYGEIPFHLVSRVCKKNVTQNENVKNENENVKNENVKNENGGETEEVQQPTPARLDIPSKALLSQLLDEFDLIGRLLLPTSMTEEGEELIERQRRRNGEQANFGHIIQMINSIAINRDLDTIRDHLNEMKDKRPELYDRWTTFVNVDVASFKEISLFYDAQQANNNVNHRFGYSENVTPREQQQSTEQNCISSSDNNSSSQNSNNPDEVLCDQFFAHFSFTRETVIPAINVDVLPRLRRSKNAH